MASIVHLADGVMEANAGTALAASIPIAIAAAGFSPMAIAQTYAAVGGGLILSESLYQGIREFFPQAPLMGSPTASRRLISSAAVTAISVGALGTFTADDFTTLAMVLGGAYTGPAFFNALSEGFTFMQALKAAFSF